MMEIARTSETSVDNYFTRQYIPEDKSELNTRRRENLISHSSCIISETERLYSQPLPVLLCEQRTDTVHLVCCFLRNVLTVNLSQNCNKNKLRIGRRRRWFNRDQATLLYARSSNVDRTRQNNNLKQLADTSEIYSFLFCTRYKTGLQLNFHINKSVTSSYRSYKVNHTAHRQNNVASYRKNFKTNVLDVKATANSILCITQKMKMLLNELSNSTK
jgi:hypothetical protein